MKDLDVWTFYAVIPGGRFPADKRVRRADFAPSSSLGRQTYDIHAARSERQRAMWQRWSVIGVLQGWLAGGAQCTAARKPSAWHLAKKAVVFLYPDSRRGYVVWAPGRNHHQPDVLTLDRLRGHVLPDRGTGRHVKRDGRSQALPVPIRSCSAGPLSRASRISGRKGSSLGM